MFAGHVLQSALALRVKTAARPGHVVQPGRADRRQHHRRVGLRPASGIHTTERRRATTTATPRRRRYQPPTEPCQYTQILCSTIDSVSRFGAVGQRGVDPASSDSFGGLQGSQAASPRFRKAVHRLASGGEQRRSRGSGQGSLATKVYRDRQRDGCAVRSVAAARGVLRDRRILLNRNVSRPDVGGESCWRATGLPPAPPRSLRQSRRAAQARARVRWAATTSCPRGIRTPDIAQ